MKWLQLAQNYLDLAQEWSKKGHLHLLHKIVLHFIFCNHSWFVRDQWNIQLNTFWSQFMIGLFNNLVTNIHKITINSNEDQFSDINAHPLIKNIDLLKCGSESNLIVRPNAKSYVWISYWYRYSGMKCTPKKCSLIKKTRPCPIYSVR